MDVLPPKETPLVFADLWDFLGKSRGAQLTPEKGLAHDKATRQLKTHRVPLVVKFLSLARLLSEPGIPLKIIRSCGGLVFIVGNWHFQRYRKLRTPKPSCHSGPAWTSYQCCPQRDFPLEFEGGSCMLEGR